MNNKMTTVTEPAYTYRARLVSIYDGDTSRFDIDLGFGVWMHNQSVRFYGIDTPEIRGEERREGLKAKAFVEGELTPDTKIILQTVKDKSGKYGRWLAAVWYLKDGEWINLNESLIDHQYADRYKE